MRSRISRAAMLTIVILALSTPMMAITRDGGQRQSPIQKIIRVVKRLISVFDDNGNDPTISVPKP